eukprot:TRINITY_DN11653_c0_g2_i2.p1 TRINITY_DN11653_c0_g2~~TRINITY_DN11653_c0_g2_i2.p1  ORF type:complete len:329 (-),score=28.70 TRINITY_DN11653_c0_g2_i2:77-1063(-)
MKFGKLLQRTVQLLPELEGWLIQYKTLKQQVKELKVMQDELELVGEKGRTVPPTIVDSVQQYNYTKLKYHNLEQTFIESLNRDLQKFNDIFVDKEEVAVISMSNLDTVYENVTTTDDAFNCKLQYDQQYADLFLLLHWVLLSFAGINKILKKHDKLTGKMLKDPYIHNVLQQPFYSTKYISEYIRTCRQRIGELKVMLTNDRRRDLVTEQQAGLCNKTMQAIQMWMDLSQNASTPSTTIPRQLMESLQLETTPLDILQQGNMMAIEGGGGNSDEVNSRDMKKMGVESSGSTQAVSSDNKTIHNSSAEYLWEELAKEAVRMPFPFSFKQ